MAPANSIAADELGVTAIEYGLIAEIVGMASSQRCRTSARTFRARSTRLARIRPPLQNNWILAETSRISVAVRSRRVTRVNSALSRRLGRRRKGIVDRNGAAPARKPNLAPSVEALRQNLNHYTATTGL